MSDRDTIERLRHDIKNLQKEVKYWTDAYTRERTTRRRVDMEYLSARATVAATGRAARDSTFWLSRKVKVQARELDRLQRANKELRYARARALGFAYGARQALRVMENR